MRQPLVARSTALFVSEAADICRMGLLWGWVESEGLDSYIAKLGSTLLDFLMFKNTLSGEGCLYICMRCV